MSKITPYRNFAALVKEVNLLKQRVYMQEEEIKQRGKLESQHSDMVFKLMEKIDKLEHLIQYSIGPCSPCKGTGMIYIGSEMEGRSLPEPCDHCRGIGKTPLDIASMMELFKKEARTEVSNELPF